MRIIPRRTSIIDEKNVETSANLKTAEQPSLQQDKKSQLIQKSNQKKENRIKDQTKEEIIKKEFKRSLLDEVLEEQAALDA